MALEVSRKPISRASGSAARAATGCRGRRRCSSGPGTARRPAARDQAPSITTVLETCSSVAAIRARPAGCSPARRSSALELRGVALIEADQILLSGELSVGPRRPRAPARARSRRFRARTAVGRLRVRTTPSTSTTSGSGGRRAVHDLEQLEFLGDGHGDHAALAQVPRCSAQEGHAPLGSTQQLDRLHRHYAQGKALVERELARVGHYRAHLEPLSSLGQLFKQLAVEVERRDGVAGAGQVEADAAGAGPDVEDRIATPRRPACARTPGPRCSARTPGRARPPAAVMPARPAPRTGPRSPAGPDRRAAPAARCMWGGRTAAGRRLSPVPGRAPGPAAGRLAAAPRQRPRT